jgi:hypothetical protein
MNDAHAIKVLWEMRDEWQRILIHLPPDTPEERRKKYRREKAALACGIRKLTEKS